MIVIAVAVAVAPGFVVLVAVGMAVAAVVVEVVAVTVEKHEAADGVGWHCLTPRALETPRRTLTTTGSRHGPHCGSVSKQPK